MRPEEIENFLSKTGKRGANTLSLLGKCSYFIDAINSEVGREIMKMDIDRHEELFAKIYEETADEKEKAEFRYLKKRLEKIAEKINFYNVKTKEVEKIAKNQV